MNAPPFSLAGETAALATALLWSLSSMAWHLSGRRVGSVPVTTLRTAIAAAALAVVHRLACGGFWPADLSGRAQFLLALSGILGAGLGDLLLFRSFLLIGPRLGMLILSLAPIAATFIAWFVPPAERLGLQALAGIAMTMGGVAWTVFEPGAVKAGRAGDPAHFRSGVLLALAGSLCIGGSYVLTRHGLLAAGGGRAFAGTLIRVAAATAFTLAALPVLGRTRDTLRALRDGRAMAILAFGVVVGPTVGIWLSLVALDWTATGVASALLGTAPLFMIPISYLVYNERPTPRSLFGTLLAVAGGALLFLRG